MNGRENGMEHEPNVLPDDEKTDGEFQPMYEKDEQDVAEERGDVPAEESTEQQ